MVKSKDAATYLSAIQLVITYYNSHGHSIRKIRCDAGSTEADASVIEHLANHHKIVVDPAAVGKQNQNPVEREAQTLIKGVGSIMADQQSLGASWWCYAVESWVDTANCRPHSTDTMENFASSQEIITGTAPDLSTKYLFPFGCPVTFVKPTGRDSHFDPASEYGIAVECSKGSNGATLVLIPGRGKKPFARAGVKRINHIPPVPATNPTPPPLDATSTSTLGSWGC
jgi:hypothetical protein